jgi:hypothetical protein
MLKVQMAKTGKCFVLQVYILQYKALHEMLPTECTEWKLFAYKIYTYPYIKNNQKLELNKKMV